MKKKTNPNGERTRQARLSIERRLTSMKPIPTEVRRILTRNGFIDQFLEMQDLYENQIDAYERLEACFARLTGRRRYSDFDSFRRVMRRVLRQYGTMSHN